MKRPCFFVAAALLWACTSPFEPVEVATADVRVRVDDTNLSLTNLAGEPLGVMVFDQSDGTVLDLAPLCEPPSTCNPTQGIPAGETRRIRLEDLAGEDGRISAFFLITWRYRPVTGGFSATAVDYLTVDLPRAWEAR